MHSPTFRALALHAVAAASLSATPGVTAAQADTARASMAPQIHGLMQLWYRTGDLAARFDGFRLRKVELSFTGDITSRVRWRAAMDFGKIVNLTSPPPGAEDDGVMLDRRGLPLQDAAITFVADRRLRLDVGQQLIPLTLEGLIGSGEIETIERSLLIADRARAGGYGHIRDIGVTLRGETRYAEYHLGTYNDLGDSQNGVDVNDQQSLVGRLSLRVPGLRGLRIGGSAGYESGATTFQEQNRAGGEVEFRDSSLTLRAEAMAGQDGPFHRLGYYGLAAYRLTREVQVVGRIDHWDPDRRGESELANALQRQFVVGGNYYIDRNARVALNFLHTTFPNAPVASTSALLLLAQVSW